MIRRARRRVAREGRRLAGAVGRAGPTGTAETISAEVIPLADAMRYLEREAPRVLSPRRPGRRGRPAWLAGSELEVRRDPRGVVLVIAPSNYPLFLPGVQLVQALVAGNGVLVKPAPGGAPAVQALVDLLTESGLAEGLAVVLPDTVEAAQGAMAAGVDHVVLTGSATTGRAVLGQLAGTLTPSTMELSGCDAVFVRPDADLDLVVRSLRFGLVLNGGATCIAPRRVFVSHASMDDLATSIGESLADVPAMPVPDMIRLQVEELVRSALEEGARIVHGSRSEGGAMRPLVLGDVRPSMRIARSDVFAPVLCLMGTDGDEDALVQDAACPYALGAVVFGRAEGARALARRVDAGVVIVNDMIVPTADPRVPFGGRGQSGFGATRGPEGLLDLSTTKVVIVRRGSSRPHLEPLRGGEDRLFLAWLRTAHAGSWRERLRGALDLMKEGWRSAKAARAARDGGLDER